MITGKVAKILSDEELILNIGLDDDVKEGMEFVIFEEGEHIFDPQSGDDLGPLETVKGRVTVYHVMPRLSRARTKTYRSSSVQAMYDVVRGVESRRRKLEIVGGDAKPVREDLTVRVGDKVHSV